MYAVDGLISPLTRFIQKNMLSTFSFSLHPTVAYAPVSGVKKERNSEHPVAIPKQITQRKGGTAPPTLLWGEHCMVLCKVSQCMDVLNSPLTCVLAR